jgi:hypothetical protein
MRIPDFTALDIDYLSGRNAARQEFLVRQSIFAHGFFS